jgi:hypothetical protein
MCPKVDVAWDMGVHHSAIVRNKPVSGWLADGMQGLPGAGASNSVHIFFPEHVIQS